MRSSDSWWYVPPSRYDWRRKLTITQALIRDLGVVSCSRSFLDRLCAGPINSDPLSGSGDASNPDDIALSTGGCVCLVAYWVFSSTIFDADQPTPDANIFPEHFSILEKFLQDDAERKILQSRGTTEALVAVGLWLQSNNHISATPDQPEVEVNPGASSEDPTSNFMRYLHLITLVALYHPQIRVRNAASVLAGLILHADPADDDRLRILYDLLENCMFASLKACALAWLREEFIVASTSTPAETDVVPNVFSGPQALETMQYVVFPNMNFLLELEPSELVEYLMQNTPFLLQAVNFGLFLFCSDKWKHVLPANMDATVKERWFEPLSNAIQTAENEIKAGEASGEDAGPFAFNLDVLKERMSSLAASKAFKAAELSAEIS
jgi:Uncharacterised protein family, YAP/Alf4/glomulin